MLLVSALGQQRPGSSTIECARRGPSPRVLTASPSLRSTPACSASSLGSSRGSLVSRPHPYANTFVISSCPWGPKSQACLSTHGRDLITRLGNTQPPHHCLSKGSHTHLGAAAGLNRVACKCLAQDLILKTC